MAMIPIQFFQLGLVLTIQPVKFSSVVKQPPNFPVNLFQNIQIDDQISVQLPESTKFVTKYFRTQPLQNVQNLQIRPFDNQIHQFFSLKVPKCPIHPNFLQFPRCKSSKLTALMTNKSNQSNQSK